MKLARGWPAYVVTAVVAIYLNVFVLVVQLFAKTPALAALAPTQQRSPFALARAAVSALFVWLRVGGLARLSRVLDERPSTWRASSTRSAAFPDRALAQIREREESARALDVVRFSAGRRARRQRDITPNTRSDHWPKRTHTCATKFWGHGSWPA